MAHQFALYSNRCFCLIQPRPEAVPEGEVGTARVAAPMVSAEPTEQGLALMRQLWIAPGKPAQNGRHERMHRTLKQETAQPPRANLREQQKAFDLFRQEYNRSGPTTPWEEKRPPNVIRTHSTPIGAASVQLNIRLAWKCARSVRADRSAGIAHTYSLGGP